MAYNITNDCIGCTLCAKNCPTAAVTGEPKQLHKINKDLCIECTVCARLCPREAITDSRGGKIARLPKKAWPRPRINTSACVGCSLCVEDCPAFCLEISSPAFRGDIRTFAQLKNADDCLGCGICARRCPIGAIEMIAGGEENC